MWPALYLFLSLSFLCLGLPSHLWQVNSYQSLPLFQKPIGDGGRSQTTGVYLVSTSPPTLSQSQVGDRNMLVSLGGHKASPINWAPWAPVNLAAPGPGILGSL